MIFEKGKVYLVTHRRKGTFKLKVVSQRKEWLGGIIMEGVTRTVIPSNVSCEGDPITIRKDLLESAIEIKPEVTPPTKAKGTKS